MYFLSYNHTDFFEHHKNPKNIYEKKEQKPKPNKKENSINYIISVFKGWLELLYISMNTLMLRFGRSRG